MHGKVLRSFKSLRESKVCVPACHEYLSSDASSWEQHISRFPEAFRLRCNALVSDRIPPFPRPVRNRLINTYCPEEHRDPIRTSEPNEACLIRIYLGQRRSGSKTTPGPRFFSLRTYKLFVDQAEELNLDTTYYAQALAKTLALLYWKAQTDANDVEFVLAPPRRSCLHGETQVQTVMSNKFQEHAIWLLDFDCCREMTQDEDGVKRAVTAFLRNDPYFPRPGRSTSADQRL